MELKKAVAELGHWLRVWKLSQSDGQTGSTIQYSCAIPVAETLLAALEPPDPMKRSRIFPPAERPPEKGDWVICPRAFTVEAKRGVYKVKRLVGGNPCIDLPGWLDFTLGPERCDVVRRAAHPLRKKDRVSFGSKEGEIVGRASDIPSRLRVFFDKEQWGYFNEEDLTLVKPYYEPEGDC